MANEKEFTIEEKLTALSQLQAVYTEIDKIKTLRGELPLEVQDLEDEIAGLTTRIEKYNNDISVQKTEINIKKAEIEDAKALIEKYKEQQENVRNNREFDFLNKEIEFKSLEIELAEKRIKEFSAEITNKESDKEKAVENLNDKKEALDQKKKELEEIISETKQDEEKLIAKTQKNEKNIDSRLLDAFKRIRKNARNGLAVVGVERNACGGCFNKIPAQRQLDIKSRKKIIVCEYCGRILVDSSENK